ncbi:unnamed protein product [Cuscuta campestris]|uniref:HTH La-type RNA-binding domain-containing protein n=1 Tax=Cuscuta campestris TaxID=132261 RepID=A0A484MIN1_9ASTE|nr:unnamed protein product [Cuscuta campestris]
MATASSPSNHSPRSTPDIGSQGINSPKSKQSLPQRVASAARTQMVCEAEYEPVPVGPASGLIPQSPHSPLTACVAHYQTGSSSDWSHSQGAGPTSGNSSSPLPEDASVRVQGESSGNENGSASNSDKKLAWNMPKDASDVGAVMGAVSWPALSECTKASPKTNLPKTLSDSLHSASQGTSAASFLHKQLHTNNANSSSAPNPAPNRQRSFKRGGGNSSNSVQANGNFSQSQGAIVEIAPHNAEKSGNSGAGLSSRDNMNHDVRQRGFGYKSHGGNEHQHQQNSNKRSNGGPRPRGDGSHYHGHASARDQERGSQEWNHNRGFGGRDAHMPPQRFPARPFIRGPLTPPFIPPAMPIRPFSPPIIYPEVASPLFCVPGPHQESFRMPMFAHMPPFLYPVPDPQLYSKIVNQIDYYFSNENLIKDMFLRGNMDDQGWVPIKLIAGFKKVSMLTDSIQVILDALRASNVIEIQGEKVRRRSDWMKWIVPPSVQYSSRQTVEQNPSSDTVAAHLKRVTLDETASNGSANAYDSRGVLPGKFSRTSLQQKSGNPITAEAGQQVPTE